MRCSVCGVKRGEVYQPHFGRALCSECFIEDVRERVRREVEKWRMLKPGDTVLLAVSGGKDSFMLLDTLPRLFRESRFIALTIVEGVPGYNRVSDVEAMAGLARELGVDFVRVDFRDYIGLELHEIVERARSMRVQVSPCTYCGVARRHIMVRVAEELGASRIATAHVLDDEVQTLLINFLRGEWRGIVKLHPSTWAASRSLARIKPLRKVYEWEAASYAYFRGYRFQETECPYIIHHPTLRARIRARLLHAERARPGLLLRVLEFLDDVLAETALRAHGETPSVCRLCGAPSSGSRSSCRLCELLEELGVKGAYRESGVFLRLVRVLA